MLQTKYLLLSRKSTDIGHGSVHQDTIAWSRSTSVEPGRRQQTLVGANRPKILQVKLIARCRGSAQPEELPTPSRGNSGNERAAPWSSPSRTRTLWTRTQGKEVRGGDSILCLPPPAPTQDHVSMNISFFIKPKNVKGLRNPMQKFHLLARLFFFARQLSPTQSWRIIKILTKSLGVF